MAIFYRHSDEHFDEFNGQDFEPHILSGDMIKQRFFLCSSVDKKNIIYTAIAIKGQEWRIRLYRELKRSSGWSDDQELIEGTLLGYSPEQNIEHLVIFNKWLNQK